MKVLRFFLSLWCDAKQSPGAGIHLLDHEFAQTKNYPVPRSMWKHKSNHAPHTVFALALLMNAVTEISGLLGGNLVK